MLSIIRFAILDKRSFCFTQTSICSLFAEINAISDEEKNIDKIIPVIAKNKMSIILNLINKMVQTTYLYEKN